jgi:HPr kinase/phosphorylase
MGIPIKDLLKESRLRLKSRTGEIGISRELTTARIQKPGLLLTGLLGQLHPDRVQVFGAAEINYLNSLDSQQTKKALAILSKPTIRAIIVTRGIEPPKFLVDFAREKSIALLTTSLSSSVFIERLVKHLEEGLSPTKTIHGVLVDVLGIGILILGKSGIGKSECALELVSRGYRLVADDIVIVNRRFPSTLFGTASNVARYYIEVRGLGILNVKELFGITAIRERKQMDIMVELVSWDTEEEEYERLGFKETTMEILGVELPHLKIPVSPGRSVATVVELAARNQLLKIMGYDTYRKFREQHEAKMYDMKKVKV